MAIFFEFSVGRASTGAENVRYITRATATNGERESVHLHRCPEWVRAGESYAELRSNLISYAEQSERDELARPRRGGGRRQTHFRVIASCGGRVPTEQAREMGREYLECRFPTMPAVAVVHQDRDHTHVHIHLLTRDLEGRKLRFTRAEWSDLDRTWAEIYGREFGQAQMREHVLKKEETRAYAQEVMRARAEGREPTLARPVRVRRPRTPAQLREQELRNYGTEKTRIRGDQRDVADGDSALTPGERAIGRFAEQCDRTAATARDALQEAARLGDREFDRVMDRGGR